MNITAFAQYAGVSKAAVSRYFNGGYLSAEKRAQIAAAVEATGYRPSMQAQMLRTRRTRQIGVIMPRLSSESCARMVEGISRVLDDQNYQLLLINTANDNTREVRALDTLRHDTVDGIIPVSYTHLDVYKRQAQGCPSRATRNAPKKCWQKRERTSRFPRVRCPNSAPIWHSATICGTG